MAMGLLGILVLGTLGVHLGNYCLRQQRDWRAKLLLVIGCVLAAGLIGQYYINKGLVESLRAPRELKQDAVNRIAARLKPFGKQKYDLCVPLSLEPGSFLAAELGFTVTLAGWQWEQIPGARTPTDVLRAPASGIATCSGVVGVRIVSSPYSDIGLLNAAVELQKALNDEGIYAIGDSDEKAGVNTIHIQIGVKP
jgi:hypothetical protein